MPAKEQGATDHRQLFLRLRIGPRYSRRPQCLPLLTPLVFEGGEVHGKLMRCFRDGMGLFTQPRRTGRVYCRSRCRVWDYHGAVYSTFLFFVQLQVVVHTFLSSTILVFFVGSFQATRRPGTRTGPYGSCKLFWLTTTAPGVPPKYQRSFLFGLCGESNTSTSSSGRTLRPRRANSKTTIFSSPFKHPTQFLLKPNITSF